MRLLSRPTPTRPTPPGPTHTRPTPPGPTVRWLAVGGFALCASVLAALTHTGSPAEAAPKAAALPTQDLYATDGAVKTSVGAIHFAVVGDTRPGVPADKVTGRTSIEGAEEAIVADISANVDALRLKFAVLLGNMVAGSTTGEWKGFSRNWMPVLAGSEISETGGSRIKSVPVCGVTDRTGDEWLTGFGASFPGVGANIGANRVASWYRYDVAADGKTWRFVVLDADKATLGSRWQEQVAWIDGAMKGKVDHVLVFMNRPKMSLAKGATDDDGGGPGELMDTVEQSTNLNAIVAVFSGNSGTNEIFLPGGRLGEAYINVSSGAPAATLARWRTTPELKLESLFDLQLIKSFDRTVDALGLAETVIDHAKARGSYEGFVGEYESRGFPIAGWWSVSVAGDTMGLDFRMWNPASAGADDSGAGGASVIASIYRADWTAKDGWKTGGAVAP